VFGSYLPIIQPPNGRKCLFQAVEMGQECHPEVIKAKVSEMKVFGLDVTYCDPTLGRFVDKPGVTAEICPCSELQQ